MVLWLALGTAMVGFSEEIAYRGLAVVGFRGGYGEVKVWLFSSILFGLLHGVNVILGQGAALTVRQVVFAFVIGSVLYAIRRISGTIIVPMVIHALWDSGSFTHVAGKRRESLARSTSPPPGGLVQNLLMFVAIVLVIVGAKRSRDGEAAVRSPRRRRGSPHFSRRRCPQSASAAAPLHCGVTRSRLRPQGGSWPLASPRPTRRPVQEPGPTRGRRTSPGRPAPISMKPCATSRASPVISARSP